MRNRSLQMFAVVSCVLVSAGVGCRSPKGPTSAALIDAQPLTIECDGRRRTRDDWLAIDLKATAVEFDASNTVWKGGHRVRLSLNGGFEPVVSAGEVVTVTNIVILGDSGQAVATESVCDALLCLPMPRPQWRVPALDAEWDGTRIYKLVVRHFYEVKTASGVSYHFQDRIGSFRVMKSKHMDVSTMAYYPPASATPPDTITTAYASGSFFITEGIALYDVRVEYQGLATAFQVWTRPIVTPAVAFELLCTESGPLPGHWERLGIEGPMTPGVNNYEIKIEQHYRGVGLVSSASGNFNQVQNYGTASFVTMIPH